MKLYLFIVVAFLGSIITFAHAGLTTSDSFIVKMDIAEDSPGSMPLLFLSSGEVIESDLSPTERSKMHEALSKKLKIKVWAKRDKDFNSTTRRKMVRFFITPELSNKAKSLKNFPSKQFTSNKGLINTQILRASSEASVNSIFYSMRTDTKKDSQCYNRAHVWNWEIHNKFITSDNDKVHMGKLWIFFTTRYIREYNYNWWFHIAPYMKVSYNSEDIVLDRAFFNTPLTQTQWSNFFMQNNAYCPEVKKYSDYEKRQKTEYCYHIKTSSYYWQPWHIEQFESHNIDREKWAQYDINVAYKNAIIR